MSREERMERVLKVWILRRLGSLSSRLLYELVIIYSFGGL
jgi:hypothetical protein